MLLVYYLLKSNRVVDSRRDVTGVDPGVERWREMRDICQRHMHNHTLAFTDAHIMLGLGATDQALARQFLDDVKHIAKCVCVYLKLNFLLSKQKHRGSAFVLTGKL